MNGKQVAEPIWCRIICLSALPLRHLKKEMIDLKRTKSVGLC